VTKSSGKVDRYRAGDLEAARIIAADPEATWAIHQKGNEK
jgi:hypothetical protein